MVYSLPGFSTAEYIPDIIKEPPISDMSFKRAISVVVVSTPFIRCGKCIVTIKIKRRSASNNVEIVTNFLVMMLMLANINIIPVRIIINPVLGMKEVSIPM